jgi:hypothetical protein
MIKFIKKKHIREEGHGGNIVIYYSILDIFLCVILLGLVAFFIQYYISHTLDSYGKKSPNAYINQTLLGSPQINFPTKTS